jgi:hypothetical protein
MEKIGGPRISSIILNWLSSSYASVQSASHLKESSCKHNASFVDASSLWINLLQSHVGIMTLPESNISQNKCNFCRRKEIGLHLNTAESNKRECWSFLCLGPLQCHRKRTPLSHSFNILELSEMVRNSLLHKTQFPYGTWYLSQWCKQNHCLIGTLFYTFMFWYLSLAETGTDCKQVMKGPC